MSSILSPQAVAFATMAAFSGTVILLAIRHQRSPSSSPPPSPPPHQFEVNPTPRPCISSAEKKIKSKGKKKVRFAEDVVDPTGDNDKFRKQHHRQFVDKNSSSLKKKKKSEKISGMPGNRMALYNSILKNRVIYRLACTY